VIAAVIVFATLLGELSLPLGPVARPGVPVLVDGSGELSIDGWQFVIEGPTLVHPPRLPFDVEGVRVREVKGELVGQGLRLDVLRPEHWRALDVFDEVVAEDGDLPAGAREALRIWRAASRVPRIGNVRPEVYDRVERPRGASPALGVARAVVIATAVVFALQMLIARRAFWALLAGVALLGAGIGLLRTRAEYRPVVERRIEVRYDLGGGLVRRRMFTAHVAVGPGASVVAPEEATPVFYRAAADAWWTGPGRRCAFDEGVVRLFLTETVERMAFGDGEPLPEELSWAAPGPGMRAEVVAQR